MAWTPHINTELFTEVSGDYVNRFTGEVVENPLTAQMLSYIFERSKEGTQTESQQQVLTRLGINREQVESFYKEKLQEEIKTALQDDRELRPYIDYQPDIPSETPTGREVEVIAYQNFLNDFLESTNEHLFDVLKKALDKLGMPDWEMGYAVRQIPQEVLVYMQTYRDSGQASSAFASDLLNYLPIEEEYRREIEGELQDISYGDDFEYEEI